LRNGKKKGSHLAIEKKKEWISRGAVVAKVSCAYPGRLKGSRFMKRGQKATTREKERITVRSLKKRDLMNRL